MNERHPLLPVRVLGLNPHNDMEIVTYVLSGALEHKDSIGNGEVLRPWRVSANDSRNRDTHSEFNPTATEPTHLYQIWYVSERKGLTPSYEQKSFPAGRHNELRLVHLATVHKALMKFTRGCRNLSVTAGHEWICEFCDCSGSIRLAAGAERIDFPSME